MNPLVSIIIPLYNSESFIADTIYSAINQTYKHTEIIIVNDGSTDASLEIATRFTKYGVVVYSQKNRGASAARNFGILKSKGELIQFLDADDLLDPGKLKYQVETYERYGDLHLIGGKWRRFDRDVSKPYAPMPYQQRETRYFNHVKWLLESPYMIPSAWLVPRRLIDLSGLWNENLSFNDDGEFFYRVVASSSGVIINHKALALYRSGNLSSLSSRKDRTAMVSWIESIRSYKMIIFKLAGEMGMKR
jgi:glycosyltransferase involved in cell wall biosynthesis